MLPGAFLEHFCPISGEQFALPVSLPILELPFIYAVFNRDELLSVALLHPIDPVALVEVARAVLVDAISLSLVILEFALIVAHLIREPPRAMHQTVMPVAFVDRTAVFN